MINGARIRQARELNRLTQAELASEIGVAQTTIAHIEGKRFQPSPEVVAALARRLGVPEAFFSRDDPPQFPEGSLLFRGHADLNLADKREAQRLGEIGYEASALMAKNVRSKITLSIPQLTDEPLGATEAARFARGQMGISPDTPIPHMIRLLEESGVWVFSLPMRLDGRDAYSFWTGANTLWTSSQVRRPVIVLSGGVPADRLRLSAAHELGHLIMHQVVRGTSKEIEDEANKFAAEFLVPENALCEQLGSPVTLSTLVDLKRHWGVSIQMLIIRAYELEDTSKRISKRQYNYLYEQLRAKGWKKQEPIDLPLEKPRALRRMAEVVFGDPINVQRLAEDLGQHPHFVKRLLDAYATKEEYNFPTIQAPGNSGNSGSLFRLDQRR